MKEHSSKSFYSQFYLFFLLLMIDIDFFSGLNSISVLILIQMVSIQKENKRIMVLHRAKIQKIPIPAASPDPALQAHVNYPENGWGNSLSKMLMFTLAEMDKHSKIREKHRKQKSSLSANNTLQGKNLSSR